MIMDKNQKIVTIATGNITDLDLIKNILETNGIKSYLKDESLGRWAPHIASPGAVGAVKIAVAESNVSRAKAIVMEMSSKGSDSPQEKSQADLWTCPSCGEDIEDQFTKCWKCQTIRPGSDDAINKNS